MKIRLAIEVQLPPLPHMAIRQSIRHIALAAKRLEVGFVAARSVRGEDGLANGSGGFP